MKRVVVQYKVQEGKVDENQSYINAIFAELAETKPDGVKYAAFLGDDGQTFTHIAEVSTSDGSNPLTETAAFQSFQSTLKTRIETPPRASWLTRVGSYGWFEP